MKKTANQKRVQAGRQKYQNDRRPFAFLPELHIPFGFNFMPDYPLIFDRRSNPNKKTDRRKNL